MILKERQNKTNKVVYQQIVIASLLHAKLLFSFPRIPFPETVKLRIGGFFGGRKCRKALWLQAREASWSVCKRTLKRVEIFHV